MEKIKGQIYIHTNKITGKHYVGQTISSPIEARWKKGGDSYNKTTKFGRAIKKYGWENFEHVILHEIYESHEELDKAEIAKIVELDSYKNGYNSTLGGNGSSGYCHSDNTKKKLSESLKKASSWHNHGTLSEEHKIKISKVLKGKVVSEETKEKMRQAKKGKIPWNKGKKGLQSQTEETREKIRQARLGKKTSPHSEETKEKIRKANTGKKHSEETKEKMRQARLGKAPSNKGKAISEETKKKISKAPKIE